MATRWAQESKFPKESEKEQKKQRERVRQVEREKQPKKKKPSLVEKAPFEKKVEDLKVRKGVAKHVRETEEELGVERGKKAFGKVGDVYKPGGKKFEKRMRQLEMKIATGKASDAEKAEYKKLKGD